MSNSKTIKENKPVLVIIFNHKFEKNIPILRKLYSGRFDRIRFIVPFYQGDESDIISVCESSYQFQGYIAQALSRLKEIEGSHFVFIGDDLILNPLINQENILQMIGVNKAEAYIESVIPLKDTYYWEYARFDDASKAFKTKGVNFQSEIPSLEEAQKKASDFGYQYKDFIIHRKLKTAKISIKRIRTRANEFFNRVVNPIKHEYPLFTGYSDFFVLPEEKLEDYAHLSGVFAAMNLFVEIAIPTALVLTMEKDKLKRQEDANMLTPKLWLPTKTVTDFEKNCGFKIDNMQKNWPDDYLYLHPVKLSKWKWDEK